MRLIRDDTGTAWWDDEACGNPRRATEMWATDIAWSWAQLAQAALQKQVQAWQDLHANKQQNSNR